MSSPRSSSDDGLSWISSFCSVRGHEYFCEVNEDFIRDSFNMTGLTRQVPHYVEAIKMILNEDSRDLDQPEGVDGVDQSAEMLYGLIHARYILSKPGLTQMLPKYLAGEFGVCPRVLCDSQTVLPIDVLGDDTVRVYCPKCADVYKAKSACRYIDGAFFGINFPEMFFMTFPERRPQPKTLFIPRLFGFKIHPSAYDVTE